MSWFEKIISVFKSEYVPIYIAIGDEDCMKITNKLRNKRIPYKTKIRGLYAGGNKRNLGFDTKLSQYDIFVKKEFEGKARNVINKN